MIHALPLIVLFHMFANEKLANLENRTQILGHLYTGSFLRTGFSGAKNTTTTLTTATKHAALPPPTIATAGKNCQFGHNALNRPMFALPRITLRLTWGTEN